MSTLYTRTVFAVTADYALDGARELAALAGHRVDHVAGIRRQEGTIGTWIVVLAIDVPPSLAAAVPSDGHGGCEGGRTA
jgi:hypothetical protein